MKDEYIGKSVVLNRPYVFRKTLGNGGFGQVYMATDNTKKHYAIKVITSGERGIPCLVEASIMATYKHPYLNPAIDIVVVEDSLYLIMDEALCDLYDWINKKGGLERGTKENKQRGVTVLFHITQALSFLHREDLIHGDIKASNVLVFPGPVFKLTDFNLSCHKNWKRGNDICTASYRPIEGWEGTWDESVDIWCLGNVIYYCLFHKHLFRSQKTREEGKDYACFLNSLYSWEAIYYKRRGGLAPNRNMYNVEFHAPNIAEDIFTNKSAINNAVLSCLHPKKEKRPKASSILHSDLFSDKKLELGNVFKLTPLHISESFSLPKLEALPSTIVIENLYPNSSVGSRMTNNTARVANNIYSRYEPYIVDDIELVITTIAMMAVKITREDDEIELRHVRDVKTLFRIERDICRRLSFILF